MFRNKNSFDVIIVILLLIVLIAALKSQRSSTPILLPHPIAGGDVVRLTEVDSFGTEGEFRSQMSTVTSTATRRNDLRESPGKVAEIKLPGFDDAEKRSRGFVEQFKSQGRIFFDPPPDFIFEPVDADELLILTGKNHAGLYLTLMAGQVKAPINEIAPFVEEHFDVFEGRIKKEDIARLKHVKTFENFNQSGDVVVLQGGAPGKAVFFGILQRKDGLGSYMFVLEGGGDLTDNTDRFEDLFSTLRTQ